MMRHTKLGLIAFAAALLAAPSWAQVGSPYRSAGERNFLRVQAGLFQPDGDGNYLPEKALEFTGNADDFEDVSIGIDYLRLLGDRTALQVSGNFFEGQADQAYLDFVDDRGRDIFHTTTLEVSSVNLGLLFYLASRGSAVVPYVGVGGGLYSWRLEESGEFIDFGLFEPEIFAGTFFDEGETFGYHYLLGLDIPLGQQFSIFAEGRWQEAEDDLAGDFQGFGTLDLSGREIRAGAAWSF